jgi:hypothetical protein
MTWRLARRRLLAVAAVLALPLAVLVVKLALAYRAIHRIAERGAVILSRSDAPGLRWMPRQLRSHIQRFHVVRESYDVRVGEVDIGCANGLTFAMEDTRLPGNDETLAALPGLDNIERLDVRSAAVTDRGLRHIGALSKLRRLTLERTNVTGTGLAHLQGLPLLQLSLAGSPVDDAGLVELPELPALEMLDLSGTLVAGPGLTHLRRLRALGWLDLSSTLVEDDGLAHLERLPRLTQVWLCGTRVSKEAVERSSSKAVRGSLQGCTARTGMPTLGGVALTRRQAGQ